VEGGFTAEAESYLKRLIDGGTESPTFNAGSAFVLLGAIFVDQKRFPEAAKAFQKALEADPDHRQASIELAGVLMEMGQPKEAVPHYLKAIERRQDDPELHFKLGLAYLRSRELGKGISSLEFSIQLRSTPLAHYNLGNALLGAGKVKEAMANYSAAIELDPNLIPAANNLAWLLSTNLNDDLRDGARAVELARKICAVPAQRSPSSLDTLGVAYAEAGRFPEAIKAVEEALTLLQNPIDRASFQKRLSLYESRKPHRE
jgi:tetratricopeptide (TPR) repeat protein